MKLERMGKIEVVEGGHHDRRKCLGDCPFAAPNRVFFSSGVSRNTMAILIFYNNPQRVTLLHSNPN